jgi:hypothetical protein
LLLQLANAESFPNARLAACQPSQPSWPTSSD